MAYSPDGAKIASTSADRSVRLRTAVVSCAFSPTGKYLLTASNYGERKIKLWYTDMPHMAEKQQVGFRIVWEATGVMRAANIRIIVAPKAKDSRPAFESKFWPRPGGEPEKLLVAPKGRYTELHVQSLVGTCGPFLRM